MTWADDLFWALVAVALFYLGSRFHEVTEAAEARLLSVLPAREVAEPTARRTPRWVESGGDTEGRPGDGGNPGAAHSRTDAAAPGAALVAVPFSSGYDVYDMFAAALRQHGLALDAVVPSAPRHAVTAPRIDVCKPGEPPRTPDAPPWETATGSQPVLSVTALAALDAGRPRWPVITGAPGGCTGNTGELPRLVSA